MNTPALIVAGIVFAAASVAGLRMCAGLRRRSVHRIVRDGLTRARPAPDGTRHVFLTVVDHFEPFWHNRDRGLARERVRRWRDRYPAIAARFHDSGGHPPRHAFFYPQEEYALAPECMDTLAEMHRLGCADVEVHLHHDRDRADALSANLLAFTRTLRDRHGLLRDDPERGVPAYAFIHGNWVLGNSGVAGKDCGVDDEFIVLRDTGCYGDFTFPSAPHPSQPPVLNRIYYPGGDPARSRAHFRALDARLGVPGPGLPVLVTGPLAINWRRRRRGVMPAIENGDLTGINPPGPDRLDLWIRTGVGVAGFPNWTFVKVHTHGAQEANAARLLGEGPGSLAGLFADALSRYNDGTQHVMHFVTPWETVQAIRALESGDPAAIRAIERFEYPR